MYTRNGKEWKDNRVLHQKQVQPRNVHCYTSGMVRATDRFIRELEKARNKQEYVDNIHPHVLNWTMEGIQQYGIENGDERLYDDQSKRS